MAGHLVDAGHEVHVFNRTHAKSEQWAHVYNGTVHDSPASAAQGCDFLFTCVGNDQDVEQVIMGTDGVLNTLESGSVIVDHTTASVTIAQDVNQRAQEADIGFIDAPISGGQSGAEQGILSIMCGGTEDHFEKALPLMESYGKTMTLIGPSGSGQFTKMVNQILCAGAIQGAAEAIAFGLKAELDMDKVIDTISKGAAGSWQMVNRAETMCKGEFEFGFAVDWMRKDLGICLKEADSNGARLPVAALVDQFYATVQARGGQRWDTSALIHLLMNE